MTSRRSDRRTLGPPHPARRPGAAPEHCRGSGRKILRKSGSGRALRPQSPNPAHRLLERRYAERHRPPDPNLAVDQRSTYYAEKERSPSKVRKCERYVNCSHILNDGREMADMPTITRGTGAPNVYSGNRGRHRASVEVRKRGSIRTRSLEAPTIKQTVRTTPKDA